jgi:REP element-mobilizing transposase RayT
MPRVNRREIFSELDIQAFHTISRCVRRDHLCGRNRRSGRDYSHRREWIRARLEQLAGIFAIEVLGYALMGNHMHLVIRTRPDIARTWSDDELALRWWSLCPKRRQSDGVPAEPTPEELNHIKSSPAALAEKRRRLASVSWFMKCTSEPIAKRANLEDGVTGHFWEARFKAQPLLDETALTACLAYVDLNPIRAAIAQTPETSEFTSIHDRILDRQLAQLVAPQEALQTQADNGPQAGWLAPIAIEPARAERATDTVQSASPGKVCGMGNGSYGSHKSHKPPGNTHPPRRCSDRGCLFMTLDQYLQLLEWTGRQTRADKAGQIPSLLEPILTRLDCSPETWLDLVQNFRLRFRTEAGRAETLQTVGELRRRCRQQRQRV